MEDLNLITHINVVYPFQRLPTGYKDYIYKIYELTAIIPLTAPAY